MSRQHLIILIINHCLITFSQWNGLDKNHSRFTASLPDNVTFLSSYPHVRQTIFPDTRKYTLPFLQCGHVFFSAICMCVCYKNKKVMLSGI
jgi:hypothetical protein